LIVSRGQSGKLEQEGLTRMSVEVSRFVNPPKDSEEYRALKKAISDVPHVTFIGQVDGIRYYQVTSSKKLGPKYPVRIWEDKDYDYMEQFDLVEKDGVFVLEKVGIFRSMNPQSWVECFCAAAYPPNHPYTNLITWHQKICYHAAAAVLHEAWYR
jgi:hypothetical protein